MYHISIEKNMVDDHTEVLTSLAKVHLTFGDTSKKSKAWKHSIKEPRTDLDLLLMCMAKGNKFNIRDAL